MFRLNGRTAQPLEPLPAPGSEKPTSRCQATSAIRSLRSLISLLSLAYLNYPLIDDHITMHHRFTTTNLRFCLTCRSHSQANICCCAEKITQCHLQLTFVEPSLYSRRRPPQSNYHTDTVKFIIDHELWVLNKIQQDGISLAWSTT